MDVIKEFAYYRIEYTHHDRASWLPRSVLKLSGEIWIFDTDEGIRHNEGTHYIFFDSDNEIVRLGKADYAIYEHQDEIVYLVKATLAIRKIVYAYGFLRLEINLLTPEEGEFTRA